MVNVNIVLLRLDQTWSAIAAWRVGRAAIHGAGVVRRAQTEEEVIV